MASFQSFLLGGGGALWPFVELITSPLCPRTAILVALFPTGAWASQGGVPHERGGLQPSTFGCVRRWGPHGRRMVCSIGATAESSLALTAAGCACRRWQMTGHSVQASMAQIPPPDRSPRRSLAAWCRWIWSGLHCHREGHQRALASGGAPQTLQGHCHGSRASHR
jgi:hypothetical protein